MLGWAWACFCWGEERAIATGPLAAGSFACWLRLLLSSHGSGPAPAAPRKGSALAFCPRGEGSKMEEGLAKQSAEAASAAAPSPAGARKHVPPELGAASSGAASGTATFGSRHLLPRGCQAANKTSPAH